MTGNDNPVDAAAEHPAREGCRRAELFAVMIRLPAVEAILEIASK